MKIRFAWGVGFIGVLFLCSCQKLVEQKSAVNLLTLSRLDSDPKIDVEFVPQLHIIVERAPSYNALLRVGLKRIIERGELRCELETKHEKFLEETEWRPIPVLFVTRAEAKSGGFYDAPLAQSFLDRLTFKEINSTAKDITFYVRFYEEAKNGFDFQSIWKVSPKKRTNGTTDWCAAETRICLNVNHDTDKDTYSCADDKWKWVKQLDALANFWGSITGLKARWGVLKENGEETMTAGEVIK